MINRYDRKMIIIYLKKIYKKYELLKWNAWQKVNAKLLKTYDSNKECARCRDCGRTVHDYNVENKLWLKVMGTKNGVWCYDCFAERARKKGITEECIVTEERITIDFNY